MNKKISGEPPPELWRPELMPDRGFPPLVMEWKPIYEKESEWDAFAKVCGDKGE